MMMDGEWTRIRDHTNLFMHNGKLERTCDEILIKTGKFKNGLKDS